MVGRGVAKRLKEMYPDAQILPLDYDPDVSFANLENRLQMLIMTEKAKQQAAASHHDDAGRSEPPAPPAAAHKPVDCRPAARRRGSRTAAVVPAQS